MHTVIVGSLMRLVCLQSEHPSQQNNAFLRELEQDKVEIQMHESHAKLSL